MLAPVRMQEEAGLVFTACSGYTSLAASVLSHPSLLACTVLILAFSSTEVRMSGHRGCLILFKLKGLFKIFLVLQNCFSKKWKSFAFLLKGLKMPQ